MKQRIRIFATLAISTSLFLASCSKDKSMVTQTPTSTHNTSAMRYTGTSQIEQDLNAIGDYHNNSLAATLPAMPYCSPATYGDGITAMTNTLARNYSTSADYQSTLVLAARCNTLAATKIQITNLETQASSNATYGSAYNQLKDALSSASSAADLDTRVLRIYTAQVAANPAGTEVLKNMCGVVTGSYDYWNANIDNWLNLHNPNPNPNPVNALKTKKEKVVEFVIGDCAGAIGGPAGAFFVSGLVAWSWD